MIYSSIPINLISKEFEEIIYHSQCLTLQKKIKKKAFILPLFYTNAIYASIIIIIDK